MDILIHINDVPVVLQTAGFTGKIDIDSLTAIDYTNLYGEAATISALLNKVGIIRAEAEKAVSDKKLEKDVYEAETKKNWRRQANRNMGRFNIEGDEVKLSEKALDEALLLDRGYQELCEELTDAEKNFSVLDALLWAIQDKSKKLNNLLKPVTPTEFLGELVEGSIVNGFIIKKTGYEK